MHRKLLKQIIYGGLYLAVIAGVVYLFYLVALSPAPTCHDNKQNQGEEQVDCGGPFCQACAIGKLQPIRTFPGLLLSSPDSKKTTLLIQFQNPNTTYGASTFSYTVTLYGPQNDVVYTLTADSFIYPGEIKYRIEPNIPINPLLVARSAITIGNVTWVERSEFSLPATQTRDIKTEVVTDRVQKTQAVVTGFLKNDNEFPLSRATVDVIMYNEFGSLVGVSKTLLENLQPFEERPFQVNIPINAQDKDALKDTRVVVEAER